MSSDYIYCKPNSATMLRSTCEKRKSKGDIIDCHGCPGPEPLPAETVGTVSGYDPPKEDKKPAAEFGMCSKCGEKPIPKPLKARKWSGGVGLCWGCYRIIGKTEPPAKRGGDMKKKSKPAPKPEPAPPAKKPPARDNGPQDIPASGVTLTFENMTDADEMLEVLERNKIPHSAHVVLVIYQKEEGRVQ